MGGILSRMGGDILLYYFNSSENLNHLQYTDDMRSEIEFQGFDDERKNIYLFASTYFQRNIFRSDRHAKCAFYLCRSLKCTILCENNVFQRYFYRVFKQVGTGVPY